MKVATATTKTTPPTRRDVIVIEEDDVVAWRTPPSEKKNEQAFATQAEGKGEESKERQAEEEIVEREPREMKEDEEPDVCSICLCPPRRKAVVSNCLHSFCMPCIEQWAHVQRGAYFQQHHTLINFQPQCPLCKAFFTVLIYDIGGDYVYKEKRVAEERVAGLVTPSHPYHVLLPSYSASASSSSPPRARINSILTTTATTTATADASSSTSSSTSSSGRRGREPRPYYYRVQRHMAGGGAQIGKN